MNKANDLLKTRYYDFGLTLTSEKLEEEHRIVINKETIRLKIIKMGLRGVRHRKTNEEYRSFRERIRISQEQRQEQKYVKNDN